MDIFLVRPTTIVSHAVFDALLKGGELQAVACAVAPDEVPAEEEGDEKKEKKHPVSES